MKIGLWFEAGYNNNSFGAVVTRYIYGYLYEVEDKDDIVLSVMRSKLWHQLKHIWYSAHVSDNKKHGRFSM